MSKKIFFKTKGCPSARAYILSVLDKNNQEYIYRGKGLIEVPLRYLNSNRDMEKEKKTWDFIIDKILKSHKVKVRYPSMLTYYIK